MGEKFDSFTIQGLIFLGDCLPLPRMSSHSFPVKSLMPVSQSFQIIAWIWGCTENNVRNSTENVLLIFDNTSLLTHNGEPPKKFWIGVQHYCGLL